MMHWKSTFASLTVIRGLMDFANCDDESFARFQVDVKSLQNTNIYKTAAHKELHRALSSQIDALTRNRYQGTNGPHSRLIQGPKGIGKSIMLQSFLALQHEKVISLYLSYDELLQPNSILKTNSVLEIVDRCLQENGIHSENFSSNNMGQRIAQALQAKDKYIFLVVDEIEQLYRVNPQNKSIHEVARSNLGDLAWLGNQRSGRFAVFLCGSSASCPLLVTCSGDKEEFPLQIGAPSLNEQRYRTLRLCVSLMNNVNEMISLLYDMGYEATEELARLMLFQVGLVPRMVHHHIESLLAGEGLSFLNSCSHHHESSSKSSTGLSGCFYYTLIQRLRKKNDEAFKMLSDEKTGRLSQNKVRLVKWETKIVPLNYEDIVGCWMQACTMANSETKAEDLQLLQHLLFRFCDLGKFSFESIDRSLPTQLYPINGAQIFLENVDQSSAVAIYKTIDMEILQAIAKLKAT